MAKSSARDWAQLDAFEAEYAERLADEAKRGKQSQYREFLRLLATGVAEFYTDEIKSRDDATRRLFTLRGKILALREKLDVPDDGLPLLPAERPLVKAIPKPAPKSENEKPKHRVKYLADPVPPGSLFPVTFDEIRATLAELPPEHVATVREIRLSNQKRTGSDADWLEGEIRLHCLLEALPEDDGTITHGRRALGRNESGQDVERFGGSFRWEGSKLYAVWPLDAYKTFVLKRVLIHEVAHGIAELPGYAAQVRSVGSLERFCEQYAENFYRPPGRAVRLGY